MKDIISKKQAFEKYSAALIKMGKNPEEVWKNSMKLARTKENFKWTEKKISNKEHILTIIAAKFFRDESVYYRGASYYYHLNKETGKKVEEIFHDADVQEYNERTVKFMKKYGDEKYEYFDGIYLNMEDYLLLFEHNIISKKELSDIIENFKKSNPSYLSVEKYNKDNEESRDSTLNGYFKR